MHSILISANAFFMIRDIFHLYLFASPLKFNISFGDAGLLPAPQNKAYIAQGYFKLFSPISSTQEQQLPFQPLLETAEGSQSQSLYIARCTWPAWPQRGNEASWGCPIQDHPKKKQKEEFETYVSLGQTHLWLHLFL